MQQSVNTVAEVLQVLCRVSRLDVKDVDHDANLLEYGRPLCAEIRVHVGVLTATVPEVQNEISEKTNMVLFDVYGGTKTSSEGSRIV
jgi:hypothetical protein